MARPVGSGVPIAENRPEVSELVGISDALRCLKVGETTVVTAASQSSLSGSLYAADGQFSQYKCFLIDPVRENMHTVFLVKRLSGRPSLAPVVSDAERAMQRRDKGNPDAETRVGVKPKALQILADLLQTSATYDELGEKHGVSKQRISQIAVDARNAGIRLRE